jgi:hypothetical protein
MQSDRMNVQPAETNSVMRLYLWSPRSVLSIIQSLFECAEGYEPNEDMTKVQYGDSACNNLQALAWVISNLSDSCYLQQLQ